MIDNLYQHKGSLLFFCLLSDDVLLMDYAKDSFKHGVTLLSSEGQMLTVSSVEFDKHFEKVAEYKGDDEAVMSMIRRANPGQSDFDFIRVFESWHESEINITGQMLDLAIAATVEKFVWRNEPPKLMTLAKGGGFSGVSVTIMTEDLQHVLQNYDITRTAVPHGYTITIVKPVDD